MEKSHLAETLNHTSESAVTRPSVTFVGPDQQEHTVEATIGQNLMKVAVNNDVDGIDGECGGNMACGTCHVYVIDDPQHSVPEAGQQESDLVDALVENYTPHSRLGCQITVTEQSHNLRVGIGNL